MDQVYQAIYGPNEDKLKHCGAAWLTISLLANVAGSNVTGFVGLLAILAVVTKSEYLLFLVRACDYAVTREEARFPNQTWTEITAMHSII